MMAPARFTIQLSYGLRLSLTLYAGSRSESSAATMIPTGCDIPIFSFFALADCKVVPPAPGSRLLPWAVWLGTVCLEVSETEAAALQEFITAVRAGNRVGG